MNFRWLFTILGIGTLVVFGSTIYPKHPIVAVNKSLIPHSVQVLPDVKPPARVGPPEIYPDPQQTPGMTNTDITQDNISQNICNPKWSTKSIRPPVSYTNPLKKSQIANGYTYNGDTSMADYEEDHLISLEIGGNPVSALNLWPESYNTQVDGKTVGARQKDTVENQLHKEICNNTISLQRGQEIIVQDWFACFVKIQSGDTCL